MLVDSYTGQNGQEWQEGLVSGGSRKRGCIGKFR
jgi:hypothetical protein